MCTAAASVLVFVVALSCCLTRSEVVFVGRLRAEVGGRKVADGGKGAIFWRLHTSHRPRAIFPFEV